MRQLEIFETFNTSCMREKGLLKTECLPDHIFFQEKKVGHMWLNLCLCENYKLSMQAIQHGLDLMFVKLPAHFGVLSKWIKEYPPKCKLLFAVYS